MHKSPLSVSIFLAFAYTVMPALSSASERGSTVLTDNLSRAAPPEVLETISGPMLEERERMRANALAYTGRIEADMAANGYAVISDADLATYYRLPGWVGNQPHGLAQSSLGFEPVDLAETRFSHGELIGVKPVLATDGRVHHIVYQYDFEDLGTVVLEELSFATMPDVRITLSEPSGNINVGGHPGGYTVLQNDAQDKAVSIALFATDSKLFMMYAFERILQTDSNYPSLLALLEELVT